MDSTAPAPGFEAAESAPPSAPKPRLIRRIWRTCIRPFQRAWRQTADFSSVAWPGAALASVIVVLALMFYVGLDLHLGLGRAVEGGLFLLIGALLVAVTGLAIMLLATILRAWPRLFSAAFIGGILLFCASPFGPEFGVPIWAALALPAVLIGMGITVLLRRSRPVKRAYRIVGVVSIVIGVAALAVVFTWAALPGADPNVANQESPAVTQPQLQAENPTQAGPFKVATMFYGSGTDRRRPEYGKQVTLKTQPVNAKPLLKNFKGFRARLRKWYWGFGIEALPLNGRVWYPQGDGPFPLVLIVHGNHDMGEFSDPGYAYLGELLASRGFITVSVDENFLNSSWLGGLGRENGVRGWVLLQHLALWRAWNEAKENPFFRKVDMANIALIGHSRGGEAIAHAAAFNRLKYFPEDAKVKFDFNFAIRTLIAIAPIDGQYQAVDQPAPLENVNYLVLQGSHDSDVSFFAGYRPFRRVKFSGDGYWMKAALYVYRANHGQFNTVWGSYDMGGPLKRLIIQKSLLPGEEQRQVAKTYIAGFLEATLHGRQEYVPMFRDHHVIASWLPRTIYQNSFEDSRYRVVSDFEKTLDVAATTVPGGTIAGENLAVWRHRDLAGRGGNWSFQKKAVVLGWKPAEPPKEPKDKSQKEEKKTAAYAVTLPEGLAREWRLDSSAALALSIADTDEKPEDSDEQSAAEKKEAKPKEPPKEEKKADKKDETKKPVDFTVELIAADGATARLPLSHFFPVQPILKVQFTKWGYFDQQAYKSATESVFQTFELPLAAFVAANPKLDLSRLKNIRFCFDRTESGVIAIDEIGFAWTAQPKLPSPSLANRSAAP